MVSRNLSGGDVGGGNATVSTSFTGYNSLSYSSSTTELASVTTQPPAQYNLDSGSWAHTDYVDTTTPSPSGTVVHISQIYDTNDTTLDSDQGYNT
jgi:hypothetical protein